MKKIIALFLVALMAVSIIACGPANDASDDKSDNSSDVSSSDDAQEDPSSDGDVTVKNSKENTPDSLPDDLNFGGITINILARGTENLIAREWGALEPATGNQFLDAVYERNLMVEERLKVKFNIEYGPDHLRDFPDVYTKAIRSGEDIYDIVAAIQAAGITYSHSGIWKNLYNAPYIDYSQPWWNMNYTNECAVVDYQIFLLQGDISSHSLRHFSMVYFNKQMYENNYGDPNQLYNVVLNNAWTLDEYARIIEESYRDENGNNVPDEDDIFGLNRGNAQSADHHAAAAGFALTVRDADGYPSFDIDHSRNIGVMEKLNNLWYHNAGSIHVKDENVLYGKQDMNFINGKTMFRSMYLYLAECYRETSFEYGVIPFPKYDENQENYIALVHNTASLYAVPITCKDFEATCAVLEATCAQSYRTVTDAFFKDTLQGRYTHDETSNVILELLRKSIMTEFAYANSASLGGLGTLPRKLLSAGADTPYMSTYDSYKGSAESSLRDFITVAKMRAELEGNTAANK